MSSAQDRAVAEAGLGPGPLAIVSADRDGIIREWNETAELVLGYSAAEAIGQSLDLVIPTEERRDHWRNFHRAMATGVLNYRPDHILDVEGLARDGTRVKLEAVLVGTHDAARRLTRVTALLRVARPG